MEGKFHYAEVIAPGAALFDYDNDGDLDVYLVQGRRSRRARLRRQQPFRRSGGRLFRNDLRVDADGTRTLRFTDVTEASGIVARGYGMGVATGDFDNDGCVDLYLTSLGPNQLFRNNCDGTFTDVSKQSRTDDPSWTVSASFLDYDRDGWLDLFVGNYLSWRVESSTPCFTPSGRPDYCSPNVYQPQPSRLCRNNRDGTFADVTTSCRHRARVRAGARRLDRRLQRRRLDGHLRGQRRPAEPAVDQPAQRHVQEHGTAVGHGA